MKKTTLIMSIVMIPLTLLGLMMLNKNSFTLMKVMLTKIHSQMMSVDIMLDWMSLLFLSTVIMISSLIIMFSKYYIPVKEQKQFLILLLMFVLSMTMLILSNNLMMILLGWDGLGLSSYILVIYYQNFSAASSGTITLLSNRVGDILILLSISMITVNSNWNFNMNMEYSLMVMLLLTIACCSKSAQFPFSAWLPMAMAAPTPISALVHSSTLVTAGIFLMLRMSSYNHYMTMTILLIISSATTLYASMSANWEQDMKKIIALSTLSQVAMMMFAISLGAKMLAFMHLIIHALFKSAMFLCAGIMIHEYSYQDMRMMGMNFTNYPLTLTILGINSMALMGIPFMSGFFSKDMIIENMMSSNMNMIMLSLMIWSIGMTASYSLRMSMLSNKTTIKSSPLMSNHESNYSNIPIMLLSLFGITSGSWLTWILSPDQMFPIPLNMKMMIMALLLLGLMTGSLLQFKAKKYIKMGMTSISLWFNHFTTITPTNLIHPIMMMYQKNDKSWQEMYGPNNSFNFIKKNSIIPENSKSSTLMIMIMMSIIPLFIML